MPYWGVFSLHKPSDSSLLHQLDLARDLPLNYGMPSITQQEHAHLPAGYVCDHTRSEIGRGPAAFAAAKAAFQRWQMFDLGWVRVANPDAPIAPDQLVAVEAHTPRFLKYGLWSVNISRILYAIDEGSPGKPARFGFAYGTTQHHVESGEERFLLEYDPVSGPVSYDLLAISRPAHWLARLGYPFTRSQQRRFARDSHARMAQLTADSRYDQATDLPLL